MMDLIREVITHACLDSLKVLPFLFIALVLMESFAHHAENIPAKNVVRAGKAGPVTGALAGSIPQCGFSIIAAGLYSGRYISRGTLLTVFIATSDEALLIILANPGYMEHAVLLLAAKIVIAVIAGYTIDYFFPVALNRQDGVRQTSLPACHCAKTIPSILQTAGKHTTQLFIFLFLFTAAINFSLEIVGEEKLSALLLNDSFFQPLMAAAVGMIPNCIPSVLLTQLYLEGMLSFSSLIAGLCSNAGLGLLMLCKINPDKRENARFIMMLYLTSVLSGVLLMIFQ